MGIPTPRPYMLQPNAYTMLGDAITAGVKGYMLGDQMTKDREAAKRQEIQDNLGIDINKIKLTDAQRQAYGNTIKFASSINGSLLGAFNDGIASGGDSSAVEEQVNAVYDKTLERYSAAAPEIRKLMPRWTAKDAATLQKQLAAEATGLGLVEKETWGTSPQKGVGPDGKPLYRLFSNQGNSQPVEGFTPEPDALKAPTTREVKRGSTIVTQEFDPASNAWHDIATAPREIEKPERITPSQTAQNNVIDNARTYLRQFDPGDVVKRIAPKILGPGGVEMDNPNYDPRLAQAFKQAASAKVGGDPDYDAFMRFMREPSPAAREWTARNEEVSRAPRETPPAALKEELRGAGMEKLVAEAKAAIERGADPRAVKQRLISMGIDPRSAGL